ncbi:MAG: Type I restriction-modification system, specificity subunit S [Nitrospira sp.]|jgi:type I restriction enzyme S subunit|nr:MAG: Type I restriction-modification system, specificity subunit S [Nitrospira sp.]
MKAGWKQQKLGEVCDFLNRGISPKYVADGGVCVLNQKCVRDHKVNFDLSRRHSIKDKAISSERFVRLGDVLVNSTGTGTLGRVAQIRKEPDEPTTVDSHVTIVRPRSNMFHLDFFGYMLVVIEDAIKEAGEGCGGQTELARSVLADRFSVNYPTGISEQKRIVRVLDDVSDGIARATANAEQNLCNARALFESHLESVFSQRGKGWVETTLSEATGGVFTGPFGSLLHKSDYIENGIPLVNPAHITETGIESDPRKTVSTGTARQLSNYILRTGDIVIGRRGEMGRCALVTNAEDGWLCGTGSFFIKPSSRCEPRYLVRFLRSDSCKRRLEKFAGGAVMPNLSNADLGRLRFHLPPIDRQKAAVQGIDTLHAETQRLESIYQQKLAALDELKKSLLHQAFSGKL